MPTATPEQIREIEELIREARDIDPSGFDEKAKAKYQAAVAKADEYYQIPLPPRHDGEPSFDPEVPPGRKDADTTPAPNGKFKTRLSSAAFAYPKGDDARPSAAWLASVKVHELLGHGQQIGDDGWLDADKPLHDSELEAYDVQWEWADRCGLTEGMKRDLRRRMRGHCFGLPDQLFERWLHKDWFRASWLAVLERERGED